MRTPGESATLCAVLVLVGSACFAAMPPQSPAGQPVVPVVESAAVPFYPVGWRMGGLEGKARLAVSTDGRRATQVRLISGSELVGLHAEGVIKNWVFRDHAPTTFEVTLSYTLEGGEPECGSSDNGTVLLRLPTEVEVRARAVKICDPLPKKSKR
jgi:hypothetical protein